MSIQTLRIHLTVARFSLHAAIATSRRMSASLWPDNLKTWQPVHGYRRDGGTESLEDFTSCPYHVSAGVCLCPHTNILLRGLQHGCCLACSNVAPLFVIGTSASVSNRPWSRASVLYPATKFDGRGGAMGGLYFCQCCLDMRTARFTDCSETEGR